MFEQRHWIFAKRPSSLAEDDGGGDDDDGEVANHRFLVGLVPQRSAHPFCQDVLLHGLNSPGRNQIDDSKIANSAWKSLFVFPGSGKAWCVVAALARRLCMLGIARLIVFCGCSGERTEITTTTVQWASQFCSLQNAFSATLFPVHFRDILNPSGL